MVNGNLKLKKRNDQLTIDALTLIPFILFFSNALIAKPILLVWISTFVEESSKFISPMASSSHFIALTNQSVISLEEPI